MKHLSPFRKGVCFLGIMLSFFVSSGCGKKTPATQSERTSSNQIQTPSASTKKTLTVSAATPVGVQTFVTENKIVSSPLLVKQEDTTARILNANTGQGPSGNIATALNLPLAQKQEGTTAYLPSGGGGENAYRYNAPPSASNTGDVAPFQPPNTSQETPKSQAFTFSGQVTANPATNIARSISSDSANSLLGNFPVTTFSSQNQTLPLRPQAGLVLNPVKEVPPAPIEGLKLAPIVTPPPIVLAVRDPDESPNKPKKGKGGSSNEDGSAGKKGGAGTDENGKGGSSSGSGGSNGGTQGGTSGGTGSGGGGTGSAGGGATGSGGSGSNNGGDKGGGSAGSLKDGVFAYNDQGIVKSPPLVPALDICKGCLTLKFNGEDHNKSSGLEFPNSKMGSQAWVGARPAADKSFETFHPGDRKTWVRVIYFEKIPSVNLNREMFASTLEQLQFIILDNSPSPERLFTWDGYGRAVYWDFPIEETPAQAPSILEVFQVGENKKEDKNVEFTQNILEPWVKSRQGIYFFLLMEPKQPKPSPVAEVTPIEVTGPVGDFLNGSSKVFVASPSIPPASPSGDGSSAGSPTTPVTPPTSPLNEAKLLTTMGGGGLLGMKQQFSNPCFLSTSDQPVKGPISIETKEDLACLNKQLEQNTSIILRAIKPVGPTFLDIIEAQPTHSFINP